MNRQKNYYETLGVSQTASSDEIKRAYRKLAVKYHPDRNPDNKEAELKFKEAAEAYEILSDPKKKQQYDQFGSSDFHGFGNTEDIFDHFSSIFEEFMGGGRSTRNSGRSRRGDSLEVSIKISLQDVIQGVTKKIKYKTKEVCQTCEGQGTLNGGDARTCGTCHGVGKVRIQQGFFTYVSTCPDCHGVGKVNVNTCHVCGGHGRVHAEKELDVTIPKGAVGDVQLRINGAGYAGVRGGPNGDLFIKPELEIEDSRYEVDGKDLVYHCDIPLRDALLGTELEVNCFSEKKLIKIPRGTQPEEILSYADLGIPGMNGRGQRGRLIVKIHVQLPKEKLSKKSLQLLEEFCSSLEHSPKTKKDDGFLKNIFN
jgi:molecular chaperone DnaJ